MRKMKDSGIAWIGEIPEGWEGIRLKELFNKKQGGAWGDEAKENENDRVCIRVADFDFERQAAKEGQKTVRNYNADVISKLQIQGNELLIEKSGGGEKTPVGRSILTDGLKGNLYANFIDKLPIKKANYPKYVAYYMKTLYQNNIVIPYIKQTTGIQNLDLESLLFEIIIVPQYIEQQQIADFLDKKCAEIDKLIELQESMIEKLKEYKQSVITQAVTKGLDPDVPMKDSGIEWIGKIPEGWEVVRIKDIGSFRNGVIYSPEDLVDEGNGTLVLRSSNIKDGKLVLEDNVYISATIKDNLMVKKGDILICSRNGSKALIGKNAIIDRDINAAFGAFMMIFRCKNPKYTYYILNSEVFAYYLGSYLTSTINQLTGKNFGNMQIIYAKDNQTQQQIADYLDKKCAEIDDLIKLKEQKIEKLKEYKKSLIYEYVTGKKEVC